VSIDRHDSVTSADETTVVYVDDDATAAAAVVEALRAELSGPTVEHVEGAQAALSADLGNVDCLVTADQLSETAGVNLVRAVRDQYEDTPVVLFGSPEKATEISAALEAGATDYHQDVGEEAATALARKVAALVECDDDRLDEPAGTTQPSDSDGRSVPAAEDRVISEIASDAVITIDESSTVRYANPAVEEVFGYEPEELIGEHLTALMPDEMTAPHREGMRRYLETGERALDWSYIELPGERKDGTQIPLSISFGEFRRGDQTFFAGIIRDVSEQKQLEANLREERNLNQHIVETSPIGIVTLDADGQFTFANERAEEILGRSKERINELSYDSEESDFVDADGEPLPPEETTFRRVLESGESVFNVEFGIRQPDGERVWVSASGSPLTDDAGEPDEEITGAVLSIEDITDRKVLEADLRAERNLNQRIVETSPVGILIADHDGEFTFANEHAERILGLDPGSMDDIAASVSSLEAVGPDGDDLPIEEMPFARVIETGEPVYEVEIGLERPDGERVWVLLNAAPMVDDDGDPTDVVFAFQDVTERKRLASELRDVFGRVTDAVYALDEDWNFQYVNDRAKELIDYRDEGLVGENIWEVFEWAEDSKLATEYREAMRTQEPTSFELFHPDPLDAWYEITAYPSETGLSVYFQDITERKERERELEEARRRYQTLVEYFPNGAVALVDEEMQYVTFGGTLEGGETVPRGDIEGKHVRDAVSSELGDVVAPAYEAALEGEGSRFSAPVDGRVFQYHFVPVRDDDGAVFAAMGMSQDITERREREEALRDREERFRTLAENLEEIVWMSSPDPEELLYINPMYEEIWGRSRESMYEDPRSFLEGVHPDDRDRVREAFDALPDRAYDETFRVVRPDGSVRWVHDRAVPVEGDDGDPVRVVGIGQDITERKEREQTLREREQRFRTLAENLEEVVWITPADASEFLYINAAYEEVWRRSREELYEDPYAFLEDVHPDDRERVREAYDALPDTEYDETFRVVRPDGTVRWLRSHAVPVHDEDGDPIRVVGIAEDITEQREREQALREERDLNQRIVETSPVGIVTLDADGGIEHANDRVEQILGYTPDDLGDVTVQTVVLDPVTPDGEPIGSDEVPTRRVVEGEQIHDREIGVLNAEGDRIWISISGTPMHGDEGEYSGAVITFADVTERRERQRALREREQQLQQQTEYTDDILDAVDDVFYVFDDAGNLQRWNGSLNEATGYSDAEIEAMHALDFFPESEHERITNAIADAFETGNTSTEAAFQTKSGERIPYELQASALDDPDGRPVLAGVARDITDRREREADLEAYAKEQQALAQLKRTGLEDVDLDDLFDETVARIADVLDHEYCKVLELQSGGDELLLRSGVGWQNGIVGTATVGTRERSQAGYTLQQGSPVVVEDLDTESRFTGPKLLTDHDVSGGISTIIGPADNPWGVLGTHTTERRAYADHEIEFVEHAAHLLATTIQRKRHESQMAALNDVTRLLVEAETPEQVCEAVIDAADGDLDLPIAVAALYDDETGRLRPTAETRLARTLREETELLDVESGVAWEAFVNDERRTGAPDERVELAGEAVHLQDCIALPLGKHGALLVGVAGEGTMPEPQLDFVETVAATLRATLDRADREVSLRDREATLQAQNEDLERLARLNGVVRGIERALVGASTRSEIEQAVCEQLATVEPYRLAWIGRHDTGSDALRRVATAGDDAYLGDVGAITLETDDPEPSAVASASGEVHTVDRIHSEPPLPDWRQAALHRGLNGAISIPIEYGGYRYGVLTVYGDRPNLFDRRERETLVDLSDTIAYAINAVESKRALVGDEVIELELELDDPDATVFNFLEETGGSFEFENVFLQDGAGMRSLFTVLGVDPEKVFEYAERSPFVHDLRQITEDDEPLFECTLTEASLIPRLYDHGARPKAITATGEGARLVVELPVTVDVRGFVEMLDGMFDTVELLARREREVQSSSRREFRAELDESLTDRQRQVLRTAYFGGFFETPRQHTGKEIGEALDISQPTFNHHLRAAQRKLFELLYGSESGGTALGG